MKATKRIKKRNQIMAFILGLTMSIMTGYIAATASNAATVDNVKEEPHIEEVIEIEPIDIPRFSRQQISYSFDVLSSGNYTEQELYLALSVNGFEAMIPYINTLLYVEQTYGVNALYLTSTLGLESGWGLYESGKNNIAGWTNANGKFRDFSSIDECIIHVGRCIATSYKKAVGSRLVDVCNRYCPDPGYTEAVLNIMNTLENRMIFMEA